jgi:acyl-coenzyme A synthetase/AMP-(fatty) acid ligase
MANVLQEQGVEKGDRVCIYLPMIPELAIATLACAELSHTFCCFRWIFSISSGH